MSWSVRLECNIYDAWVGIRAEQHHNDSSAIIPDPVIIEWHVWVCLLPFFPIHVVHTTIAASRVAGIDP
jgi:hypothetical protein